MIDIKFYGYDPKSYLELYAIYKGKAAMLRGLIAELEDPRGGTRLDGQPKKNSITHPTEEAAFRLAEAKARYQDQIEEADAICDDVLDTVNSLEPRSATLLYEKYLKRNTWEQVARKLYYSEPYVKKELHQSALDQLQIELKRKGERWTSGMTD